MLRTVRITATSILLVAVCVLALNHYGCNGREGIKMEKVKSSMAASARRYDWKAIGVFGCHGVLDAHPDPNNPDKYIIIWQRYAPSMVKDKGPKTVENVRFSIYDARTKTFSPAADVFDVRNMTIYQGHPCWGYSHGKYRVFYCQRSGKSNHIAEVTASSWADLQKYPVSNTEPVVTPDLGGRPMSGFLAVDDSTAWLFCEGVSAEKKNLDSLSYFIFHKDKGWDGVKHDIPTKKLIGRGDHLMGTAMVVGGDIVLYSSVGVGEKAGNAYRFRTSDRGGTWTAERLTVSGVEDPFKRDIDTQLFTTVVRKGRWCYLCSQSHSSHRWLARGTDGVHFKLVVDFGKRRSLSNTMVNIKGTRDILLVYADYPYMASSRTCYPGIKKTIEYVIYDTGESD
ncbi:MAG: hypothetical protein SVV80_04285 [Planctomycetota bacterium]|nr:hypothetical protein [Planctomycetota bacterium]